MLFWGVGVGEGVGEGRRCAFCVWRWVVVLIGEVWEAVLRLTSRLEAKKLAGNHSVLPSVLKRR